MYTLLRSNYLRRSLLVNGRKPRLQQLTGTISHYDRVTQELRDLGVSKVALKRMESRYLPNIIHSDEHLGGVVYGHHEDGYAMLVATDRRIIFLDKKPLFVNEDEITYNVVSGISYGHAGFGTTVKLHTRIKDYTIRTYNKKCAESFVEYIESRCLEHESKEERHDHHTKNWIL